MEGSVEHVFTELIRHRTWGEMCILVLWIRINHTEKPEAIQPIHYGELSRSRNIRHRFAQELMLGARSRKVYNKPTLYL